MEQSNAAIFISKILDILCVRTLSFLLASMAGSPPNSSIVVSELSGLLQIHTDFKEPSQTP